MGRRRASHVAFGSFSTEFSIEAVARTPQVSRSPEDPRNGHTKKKGRLRCHKRPKSREETPKEGCDSGGSAIAYPIDKTSRLAAQLNVGKPRASQRVNGPIRRFKAFALKAARRT